MRLLIGEPTYSLQVHALDLVAIFNGVRALQVPGRQAGRWAVVSGSICARPAHGLSLYRAGHVVGEGRQDIHLPWIRSHHQDTAGGRAHSDTGQRFRRVQVRLLMR